MLIDPYKLVKYRKINYLYTYNNIASNHMMRMAYNTHFLSWESSQRLGFQFITKLATDLLNKHMINFPHFQLFNMFKLWPVDHQDQGSLWIGPVEHVLKEADFYALARCLSIITWIMLVRHVSYSIGLRSDGSHHDVALFACLLVEWWPCRHGTV